MMNKQQTENESKPDNHPSHDTNIKPRIEDGTDIYTESDIQELLPAIHQNNSKLVRMLLNKCDNSPLLTPHNKTLLHWVVTYRDNKLLQILIKKGVKNIDAQDNRDKTPLHIATSLHNIEASRLLLEHGADIDAQDELGQTPLYMASSKYNIAMSKMLIQYGANFEIKDKQGFTPLQKVLYNFFVFRNVPYARDRHKPDALLPIITLLIENSSKKNKRTLEILHDIIDLMNFPDEDMISMINGLITIEKDHDIRNENAEILLKEAVSSAHLPAVKCFLPFATHQQQCGNILASFENVTLFQAVEEKDVQFVNQLLAYPEIQRTVTDDKVLLDTAKKSDHGEIKTIFGRYDS